MPAFADEAPLPNGAQKASWTAELIRPIEPSQTIPELNLFERKLSVTLVPKAGKLRPSVEIKGSFAKPGWALFVGKTRLIAPQFSGAQSFGLVVYLNGRTSEVQWSARGPKGEVVDEKIILLAPEAQEFRIGSQWGDATVFLGLTSFHFFQSQFGSFDSKTGMFAVRYDSTRYDSTRTASRFGLTADMNLTYFTLAASPSKYSPQTLAANVDGTFRPGWKFFGGKTEPTFLLGLHYITMLANGFPYGFSNLIAPQVGLRLNIERDAKNAWITQARYVPLGGLISTEAEVDFYVGWQRTLANTHRVEIDLGYWKLGYRPTPATTITNSLLYIRVGYSI